MQGATQQPKVTFVLSWPGATERQSDMAKKEKSEVDPKKIQEAAAVAVGDKIEASQEVAVVEVLPPYLFGEPAPEGVIADLSQDMISTIDPAFLSVVRGRNARNFSAKANVEALDEMVASLLANGQENPIKVEVIGEDTVTGEGPRIAIVAGETRLRAILKIREDKGAARFPNVRVILAPEKSEIEREIEQVTDNSGNKFSMFELLTVMQRLMAAGMRKKADIQERLVLSHTAVRNLEILGWATPAIREAVEAGWLTATWVIEKLRETNGEPEKINLAEKAILKVAAKRQAEGQQAAKGSKVDDDTEAPDGRVMREKNGMFNRATYNSLVSLCRSIYTTLGDKGIVSLCERAGIDNKDDQDALAEALQSAVRQGIENCFESAEIPFTDPAVTEAAEKAKAAKDKADEKAKKEAEKAVAAEAKAAAAKAKADEAKKAAEAAVQA